MNRTRRVVADDGKLAPTAGEAAYHFVGARGRSRAPDGAQLRAHEFRVQAREDAGVQHLRPYAETASGSPVPSSGTGAPRCARYRRRSAATSAARMSANSRQIGPSKSRRTAEAWSTNAAAELASAIHGRAGRATDSHTLSNHSVPCRTNCASIAVRSSPTA